MTADTTNNPKYYANRDYSSFIRILDNKVHCLVLVYPSRNLHFSYIGDVTKYDVLNDFIPVDTTNICKFKNVHRFPFYDIWFAEVERIIWISHALSDVVV